MRDDGRMPADAADIAAAVGPALAGTAFDVPGQGGPSSVLWCVHTPRFRERHPDLTEALDHQHPDGCTDLTIEVDAEGRLSRFDIEMLDLGTGLVGRPIEDVLPEVVARLRQRLR
jgi:hypothetical protein